MQDHRGEWVIETSGLTRSYFMGAVTVEALRGVDLRVRHGEFLAIMGASGSGKSTMMNILGCLDLPTGGEYRLDGHAVEKMARVRLAEIRNLRIGFVFQGFNLLARTSALENVELPLLYRRNGGGRAIRRQAVEALERVGLGERMHHVPSELSGGQQQRVAIARALVTRPSILLADEPTGNLDSRTSVDVLKLFEELHQDGMTILMITHEPDVATYAGRIVELRDGLVIRDERSG